MVDDVGSAPGPAIEPGIASVEDGFVVLDGPSGTAVTMTVEAAEGTAQSLLEAARLARNSGVQR